MSLLDLHLCFSLVKKVCLTEKIECVFYYFYNHLVWQHWFVCFSPGPGPQYPPLDQRAWSETSFIFCKWNKKTID